MVNFKEALTETVVRFFSGKHWLLALYNLTSNYLFYHLRNISHHLSTSVVFNLGGCRNFVPSIFALVFTQYVLGALNHKFFKR